MVRTDWFLLIVAYASLFVFGLLDTVRGPLFPDILREFTLNDKQGSFFFFMTSGSALVSTLFSSYYLRKLGALGAQRLFTVIQGLSLVVTGFAPSFAWVLVGASLLGMSTGALAITVNLLTVEGTSPSRRRQALSGLHCMYGVASLVAPLLVIFLTRQGELWRDVYLWVALGPAIVGVVSFFPHRRTTAPTEELKTKMSQAEESSLSFVGQHIKLTPKPWLRLIQYAVLLALYVVAEVLVGTRLVLFARREGDYSADQAGFLLALFFFLLFLGRLLLAVTHLPFRNRTMLTISAAASAVCFSLGLLVDPIWLSLTGAAMSIFYPCAIAFLNDEMGEWSGVATGWAISIQSLALMSVHVGVGTLSDAFGLGRALWIGPICLILAVFILRSAGVAHRQSL